MITHDYTVTEHAEDGTVEVMASIDEFDDAAGTTPRIDVTLWDADGDAITLTKSQYMALTRFVDNLL